MNWIIGNWQVIWIIGFCLTWIMLQVTNNHATPVPVVMMNSILWFLYVPSLITVVMIDMIKLWRK